MDAWHQNDAVERKRGERQGLVQMGWHALLQRYIIVLSLPHKDAVIMGINDTIDVSIRNVGREELLDQALKFVEDLHVKLEIMPDKPGGLPKDGWKPKKPDVKW